MEHVTKSGVGIPVPLLQKVIAGENISLAHARD
jgi:hypothetical protein